MSGLERVAEELMGRRKWTHIEQQEENTDFQADILPAEPKNATVSSNGLKNRTSSQIHPRNSLAAEEGSQITDSNPVKATSNKSPDGPQPIDWDPKEKCYICDGGKLLAVDDQEDSISDIGQAEPTPSLTTPLASDSDSSEIGCETKSSNGLPSKQQQNPPLVQNPKMTSLESVVAAVASMHGIPSVAAGLSSLYPNLWYPFGSLQTDGGDSSGSGNGKTGHTHNSGNGEDLSGSGVEQPLDLSAKSGAAGGLEQKNIFKAKPRMTTISGRRTYTEDELQNALQDILSGKLGTRRAAVLYGIPRSTLRNKVYKLAIEQKREANLAVAAPVLADLDEDDKDCSGAEEEKEVERTLNSLPSEDIFRLAASQGLAAFEQLGKMEGSPGLMESDTQGSTQRTSPNPSKPSTPAMPMMDPNIILQGLLIGNALSGLTNNKALEHNSLGMLPEFLRNFLLRNELLQNSEGRASKSITPETASVCSGFGRSSSDHNDQLIMDESQLKTPSFNALSELEGPSTSPLPTANCAAGFLTKNGDVMAPHIGLGESMAASSRQPNLLGMAPSNMCDSGSPPLQGLSSVSLRDVIAKSISKTMQPPVHLEKRDALDAASNPSALDQYKWPAISVKKGLGAEISRFGGMSGSSSAMMSNSASLNNQLNNSTGTGGKGTRPKRGKYRNYDRDSLVEAVKAVQRGEMSVHRAGSYYGVPHSTLEYKVKERHLMRPRKREPKPQAQPGEDRSSNANSVSAAAIKANEIAVIRSPMDKSKNSHGSVKSPLRGAAYDSNVPNGMKGSTFLDTAAAHLSYAPHMFWQHQQNFPGMSLDFSRAAAAAAAAAVGPSSSTVPFPTSDSLFAAQMRQRFQEHAGNSEAGTSNGSGSGSSSAHNSKSTTPNSAPPSSYKKPVCPKTTREFAESLYDGTSANGLLDGIIRHSLDRKTTELQHGTLLDQLKSNLHMSKTPDGGGGGGGASRKREAVSPLDFGLRYGIKKERASPDDCQIASESFLSVRSDLGSGDRKAAMDLNGGDAEGRTRLAEAQDAAAATRHAIEQTLVEQEDNDEDSS